MPDILRFFIIILLVTISLSAYFLVVNTLFPQRIAKSRAIIQSMPARSFGVGLVNFAFFSVIAIVLLSVSDKIDSEFLKGVVMLPALIIIGFIAILLTFGLAGMACHVGEKIVPDTLRWKQIVWGAICVCFACALPFAGWFLLFPYIGCVSIGAFILGIFQREPKA